jgi:hypothetical protein
MLRVEESTHGRHRLTALRDDQGNYGDSVDRALIIEESQRRQCGQFGADFVPPAPYQLVVVDDGALAGGDVRGVRYPSRDHMSGWWITRAAWPAVDDLETIHLPHVILERPDLVQLLALPFGWRFATAGGHTAWFDEAVARDEG